MVEARAQADDPEAQAAGAPRHSDEQASCQWHLRTLLEDADRIGAEITHVAFDGRGLAWLSTDRGLVRSDGVTWERLGREQRLPTARIRCTHPVESREVWVGLENGAGVIRGGVYTAEPALDGRSVRRIRVEPDGTVWFCCDRDAPAAVEGGLVRIRGDDVRSFGRAQHPALAEVFDLVIEPGRRRAATGDGIVEIADDRFAEVAPKPPGEAVFAFIANVDGSLLASTSTGLHQHDGSTWRTLHPVAHMPLVEASDGADFSVDPGSTARFWRIENPGVSVRSASLRRRPAVVEALAEAPDGALWAVGPDLLMRWGRRDIDLRFHRNHAPPVGEDSAGRVWFASAEIVGHLRGGQWQDEPDLTVPVCVTAEGDVWAMSSDGAGLVRIRGEQRHRHVVERGSVQRCRLVPGRRNLLVLAEDAGGLLSGRLHAGGEWHRWRMPQGSHPPLHEVVAVNDPDDGFWLLSGAREGATLLRADSSGLRPVALPPVGRHSPSSFTVADDGRRWLVAGGATWTQEAASSTWQEDGDPDARAEWVAPLHGRVAAGKRGADGMFRVAMETAGGWLDCPLPSDRPLHPVGAGILGSGSGRLYLVSPGGTPRALPMPAVTDVLATLLTRAGEIWVGTADGAFHLRPDPRLHVVQLTAPRVRSSAGEAVWLPVSVRVPFRPQAASMMPCFSYRLRVDDGAWSSEAPLREEIELAGLAAGVHRVEMEVSDPFGRVNSAPARETIEVLPVPLQARRWFPWALLGVALALASLLAHALVSRRYLRRRARRLGEVVENRTRKIRVELQRRIEIQARLDIRNQVLTQLATGQPLEDAMAVLIHDVEAQAPGWRGAICAVSPRRELLILAAPSLPFGFRQALAGRTVRPGADPCGDAVGRSGFWVEERLAERTWSAEFERLRATLPLGASCAQPLLSSRDDVLGAICLFAPEPCSPTPAIVAALQTAARIATLAIQLRRGEQERRHLQVQMQEAQRLESLGLLAGGIAHDFNNLLTGILGHTGLARRETTTPASFDDTLAQVELAAQRAADLCAQLLAYSGRGRFVVRPLDVSQIVREMSQILRVSVSGKHGLTLDLADDLPAVEGDATQIGQVVMNLLTNAREAIGDVSGVVSIRTGVVDLDASRLQHCVIGSHCQPGRYVMLEVRDTGIGMSESTLGSIFDPFFTTKFTGRGLGLAAVHGIVRGHAGAMEIDSRPGAGSSFRMFLPASARPTELRPPIETTPTIAGAGLVLVVDDEKCVRDVTRTILEAAGFDVMEAADGDQALALVAKHRAEIRLVLLDLILPRLSGEEILARLRAVDPRLPVILSSGFDVTDVATHLADDAGTHFLKKPYGPSELLITVRAAVGASTGPAVRADGEQG